MHYIIEDKIIVKSENAAKSYDQPNKRVLEFIDSITNSMVVLDYGCGKFRYTIPLSLNAKAVIAIDSKEQIERTQTINKLKTTLLKYAKEKMSNVKVFELQDDKWKKVKYDIVLCTNVLSAIPNYEMRLCVLKNIKASLNNDGKAFISVQYRNSYFNSYNSRNNTYKYYDGWIIRNNKSYSFYGIIKPNEIISMCSEAGLKIINFKLLDGSIYIIAGLGM